MPDSLAPGSAANCEVDGTQLKPLGGHASGLYCPTCEPTLVPGACTCPGPYTIDTTCPVHGDDD